MQPILHGKRLSIEIILWSASASLFVLGLLCFMVYTTEQNYTFAEGSDSTDLGYGITSANASVTVGTACTFSAIETSPHTSTISNGISENNIGTTVLKTTCNDSGGYALYAIGYTDDTYGNTSLTYTAPDGVAVNSSYNIPTGTATSGNTSSWAVKLGIVPGSTPATIENGYNTYNIIPEDYTKVATLNAITDPGTHTSGSSVYTTYQAYISPTQPAGTYTGKVKYTMVHPSVAPQPQIPVDLYDIVAAMSKGVQDAAALQAVITAPTTDDPSTDTSNSGVYEYNAAVFGESSDANNDHAIYYYRGILEQPGRQGSYGSDGQATTYPNYVRLGNNTCWRIVRTTGSGGVKMIYNGVWDTINNTCANSTTSAQAGTSAFNGAYKNAIYVGYTYNESMEGITTNTNVDTVFGSNTTLNNTKSTIKTYIEDTWYPSTMKEGTLDKYTNKLEPSAGYCSDRTVYDTSGNQLTSIVPQENLEIRFGSQMRVGTNGNKVPSLTCPRGDVDIYSYTASSTTDYTANELKYPVALLTADEVSLAGNGYSGEIPYNSKSYLNSGSTYWLFSPFFRSHIGYAFESLLNSSGNLYYYLVSIEHGVRPVISLKPGTMTTSGHGTATEPWTINE